MEKYTQAEHTAAVVPFNIRRLPAGVHRQLKIRAAQENKTLEQLIIELLLLATAITEA